MQQLYIYLLLKFFYGDLKIIMWRFGMARRDDIVVVTYFFFFFRFRCPKL